MTDKLFAESEAAALEQLRAQETASDDTIGLDDTNKRRLPTANGHECDRPIRDCPATYEF